MPFGDAGFLSEASPGGAILALPAMTQAQEALALLEAAAGTPDGAAAGIIPGPLAANERLLAVCMRSLPEMLTGVIFHAIKESQGMRGLATQLRRGLIFCACVHKARRTRV